MISGPKNQEFSTVFEEINTLGELVENGVLTDQYLIGIYPDIESLQIEWGLLAIVIITFLQRFAEASYLA